MAQLETKATILFEPAQYQELKRLAKAQGKAVGELVREAVAEKYHLADHSERLAAVERLASMRAPVADWEQMEEEILRGTTE